MVNKAKRRGKKKGSGSGSIPVSEEGIEVTTTNVTPTKEEDPPPPPQENERNWEKTREKYPSSSSLETSPMKVLVDSSKCNVDSQTQTGRMDSFLKQLTVELIRKEKVEREEGEKCFGEIVETNLTEDGVLDLVSFVEAGGGKSEIIVVEPPAEQVELIVGGGKEGGKGRSKEPSLCLLVEDKKQETEEQLDKSALLLLAEQSIRKAGSSISTTASTSISSLEFEDEVVDATTNAKAAKGSPPGLRPPPIPLQYINLPPDDSRFPPNLSEVYEDTISALEPFADLDAGIPDKTDPIVKEKLPEVRPIQEEKENVASDGPTKALGQGLRTYRVPKKRTVDGIPTTGTTILRASKLEAPSQPPPPPPSSFYQLGSVTKLTDINKTLQELQRYPPRECIADKCKKKPSVPCPSCKNLVYCTDRHRKIAKKIHEQYCNAFREIENKTFGKHMITARDIKRAVVVMTEEPVLLLPLNPSLESRTFPSNYCVRCLNFNNDTKKRITDNCVAGCDLPICYAVTCRKPVYTMNTRREYDYFPDHTEVECKVLSTALLKREIGKHSFLITDQSVLGLLRCIGFLNKSPPRVFRDLLESIKLEPYTKNFESKLYLVRNLLLIDHSTVTDEILYKIDQCLLRFGRNIGPDIVTFKEIKTAISMYFRGIYPNLANVIHSCVPNTMLLISSNLAAIMCAVKEMKKGDILSFCYDERSLFMPTRQRQRFLLNQFGYTCKCKRCSSPSELDTFYYSFPCSRCPKGLGFLVPDNPLDPYSNWMCNKCKKTSVFYLRITDTVFNFEEELATPIQNKDPLGLLNLMVELVDQNYLHWNHYLIFQASIELFRLLWDALNANDLKVMGAYSKMRGLQFLKPAETVINLTQTFMPDGYANSYILPIRLSALIKLRHLTDQLQRKETTLEKIDYAINEMYSRGYDITKCPLYDRHLAQNTPIPSMAERNLKIMEMRVVKDLMKVVVPLHGTAFEIKAKGLQILYRAKMSDIKLFEVDQEKRASSESGCIFPWDIQV